MSCSSDSTQPLSQLLDRWRT